MNKISKGQLTALLLISDTFALFCLTESVSLVTALGMSLGTLLQFLLSMPLISLISKQEKTAKWAEIFYFAYLVFRGGVLFSLQWKTSKVIYIPYENSGGIMGKLLISGLIALVCLYISSTGIKALSRAAVIAAAVGAVSLTVITISSLFNANWENLTRTKAQYTLTQELIRSFAVSGGLGSFVVMLKMTKGSPLKSSAFYFIGKLIISLLTILTSVIVAGGIMEVTDFPIVTAAQLSQPFSVQRIDSLFLIVFTVFAVFSIAVQTVAAAILIGEIIPDFKRYRSTCALVLMIGAAFVISARERYDLLYAGAAAAAIFVVPVIMLLQYDRRKKT